MAIKKDDNPTIKLEQLRYPDIAFSNEVPAVPATTERDGNVTINNMGVGLSTDRLPDKRKEKR